MDETTKRSFTRADWFKLFLVTAFLPHMWSLLMIFRDVPWVSRRTDLWDGIGFAGYGLLYTLLESVLLFGFIALLSLLTPRQWGKSLRITILSVIAFALASWSILEQLILIVLHDQLRAYAAENLWLISPVWLPQAMMAAIIALTTAIAFLLLRNITSIRLAMDNFLDRVAMLSGLYLVLDVAGFVVIVVRNVTGA
jgi:hypothetical protein